MLGSITMATAAASAGPEPLIPPMIRQTSTATVARPPWRGPISAWAKRTRRSATPAFSNTRPVSMNSGMAISGYLATPL